MYRDTLKPITSYPQRLAKHIADSLLQLSSEHRILDVGCGRGEIAQHLADLGLDVAATDYELPPREARSKKVDWHQMVEADSLPFPDESFEIVYAKSVIEHQRRPEDFVRECARVMKPGGRLMVLTPDWVRNQARFYEDHTHYTPFTRVSLENLLLLMGLDDVVVQYLTPLPSTWNSPILAFLSRVIGPLVPPSVKIRPLRWSRERQLVGIATKPTN